MCWQDVRIARSTASNQVNRTTDTNVFLVAGPNPRRTALIILGLDAGTCHVSTNPAMVTGEGVHVSTTSAPHRLLLSEYGGAVRDAWYGLASGAGNLLSLIEAQLPERENELSG